MGMNDPEGFRYDPVDQFTMQTKTEVNTPLSLEQILGVLAQQAAGRIPVQVISTRGVKEVQRGDKIDLEFTGHDSITITFLPPLGTPQPPQKIELDIPPVPIIQPLEIVRG